MNAATRAVLCSRWVTRLFLLAGLGGVLLVTAPSTAAAPERGEMRLGLHAVVGNAYLIDSHRFQSIDDVFRITLDELDRLGTTSSSNLFSWGVLLQLEYGLHKRVSLGVRSGFENALSGSFRPNDFRIPLTATLGISLWDWLELQPEFGMKLTYNQRTTVFAPNMDIGMRVRILDRIDLHGGFLYGTVVGFQFSVSFRLFDIFSTSLL